MLPGGNQPHRSCLPLHTHPLYKLRKLTLWIILIGVFSDIPIPRDYPDLFWTLILYLLCAIFIAWDLISYATAQLHQELAAAHRRAYYEALVANNEVEPLDIGSHANSTPRYRPAKDNDDNDEDSFPPDAPRWPTRMLIWIDFALSFSWLVTFSIWIGLLAGRPYYYGYNTGSFIMAVYATLFSLAMSSLHGIAFWKELKAMRHRWRKEFAKAWRCESCGGRATYRGRDVNEDMERAEGGCQEASVCGGTSKLGPRLPRWMRFATRSNPEAGDHPPSRARSSRDYLYAEPSAAVPDDSSTSLLLAETPEDEDLPSASGLGGRGHGTLGESVACFNNGAEGLVRKKSARRVPGMDEGNGVKEGKKKKTADV